MIDPRFSKNVQFQYEISANIEKFDVKIDKPYYMMYTLFGIYHQVVPLSLRNTRHCLKYIGRL